MAAADYAEGTGEPPPELELAQACERWHALPEMGGLLDQPAGLIKKMGILLNIFNSFRAMLSSPEWATWKKENPEAAHLIDDVIELRKQYGS